MADQVQVDCRLTGRHHMRPCSSARPKVNIVVFLGLIDKKPNSKRTSESQQTRTCLPAFHFRKGHYTLASHPLHSNHQRHVNIRTPRPQRDLTSTQAQPAAAKLPKDSAQLTSPGDAPTHSLIAYVSRTPAPNQQRPRNGSCARAREL